MGRSREGHPEHLLQRLETVHRYAVSVFEDGHGAGHRLVVFIGSYALWHIGSEDCPTQIAAAPLELVDLRLNRGLANDANQNPRLVVIKLAFGALRACVSGLRGFEGDVNNFRGLVCVSTIATVPRSFLLGLLRSGLSAQNLTSLLGGAFRAKKLGHRV